MPGIALVPFVPGQRMTVAGMVGVAGSGVAGSGIVVDMAGMAGVADSGSGIADHLADDLAEDNLVDRLYCKREVSKCADSNRRA